MQTFEVIMQESNCGPVRLFHGIDKSDIAFLFGDVATAQLEGDIPAHLASEVRLLLSLLGKMRPQEFLDHLDSRAEREPSRAAGYAAIAKKSKMRGR